MDYNDDNNIDNQTPENDELETTKEAVENSDDNVEPAPTKWTVPPLNTPETSKMLSGLYQTWFLDYASYVNLVRSVPNIIDGLKPVQRRILHAMKKMDDGRYNKVASIVGDTMHYHPHGDASIYGAIVQLGQKETLIDTQGNWGHVITGDSAAAPRYIEARLSHFAKEVLFSPKITQWKKSYDGRNDEPIALPVKFPLLLVQGSQGIGVGLNSYILPHNFNEVIDAAIAYLKGEDFTLYPDFPTGGMVDVRNYQDGRHGGSVRVRAKIEKVDAKTIEINEIAFDTTTKSLEQSIIKANERGKIKVKKIENLTAEQAKIVITLQSGVSSDKTIDALYALTECEVSLSPNCCVIQDQKPKFLGVSDVLKVNVDNTKEFLRQELVIQQNELREQLFSLSLERIFIEQGIYKDKQYEQSPSVEEAITYIDSRLEPFKKGLSREVTRDDVAKLLEIKMGRIIKYRKDKAEEDLQALQDAILEVQRHLDNLVNYTITWFKGLKARYGAAHPRKTEIRTFDSIQAAKVVEANEKLYINRDEGFIGTALKKDEFVCNCSDMDDIILFFKDGTYKVVKVDDKVYVGKDVIYLNVFKKNDKRTIYNTVYRDGKAGNYYIKRFNVGGVTRDKIYNITQGTSGSKVIYFTANPNGEAETIKVTLKPKARLKVLSFERDFSEIAIKGKQAMGNILSKNDIHKITLKHQGGSTLGGRNVWFDPDVKRLNYDGHGTLLGEFHNDDQILVINSNAEYRTTSFDLSNHFDDDILLIEKFDASKTWTAVLFDAEQNGLPYIKRFLLEPSDKKIRFIGDNPLNKLLCLSSQAFPRFQIIFGGDDKDKPNLEIEAADFISVKGIKAKGKRVSSLSVKQVNELTPLRFPDPLDEETTDTPEPDSNDDSDNEETLDDITGQMKLF